MGLLIALIVLILVALAIAVSCIKIVPQANAIVVERLYLWPSGASLHATGKKKVVPQWRCNCRFPSRPSPQKK